MMPPAISSDSFDQAVQVGVSGEADVSDEMKAQGITLSTSIAASTFYTGFNWLDPVVGGWRSARRARKLRQGPSAIAVDLREEYVLHLRQRTRVSAQISHPARHFRLSRRQGRDQPVRV